MAVILASGTTAANSSDIAVTAGTPVTIFLSVGTDVPVPSQADCDVQVKDAGGKYHTIGKLTGREAAKAIDSPGTYRVARAACSEAFAVEAV
jgi:thiamine monophosphate kinase